MLLCKTFHPTTGPRLFGSHFSVILVLLDLKAAFDTVDHSMLLRQLYAIGIRESALAWLTSYLSDRTLAIKIGDVVSRQQRLECGVPQGSVLGPLLFTIYILHANQFNIRQARGQVPHVR